MNDHCQTMDRIGAIRLPINRLHMEITNACNFSCEFCPDSRMKRKRGMMPLAMAKAIIDEVSEKKLARLLLFHLMGEPTLHPHLIDMVKHATARGVDTCLMTNGSRLDDSFLDDLIAAGIGWIVISLQTPDEKTFTLRSARGIAFEEYERMIVSTARRFLIDSLPRSMDKKQSSLEPDQAKKSALARIRTKLTISFLSSPLRRLITPIFPEVSIADTSTDLKEYLSIWLEKTLRDTLLERQLPDLMKKVKKSRSFKENTITISDRLSFHTRIMGDWPVHFDRKNVNAYFGYCPGIQENFGILYNGNYTFCCADYDGRTSIANFKETSIQGFLSKEVVQRVVKGFNRFRVFHPYCKQCLGEKNLFNTIVKQFGSIAYFKWIKGL